METFRELLRSLKNLRDSENLKTDDNILFDGAIRMYNSLLINANVQLREKKSEGEPLTQKQRELLQRLDYKGTMELTKKEAATIISQYLGVRERPERNDARSPPAERQSKFRSAS